MGYYPDRQDEIKNFAPFFYKKEEIIDQKGKKKMKKMMRENLHFFMQN